tara:strand:+ start:189 stop:551 length:363 start_codon:yes stop_codon:yes gene_type:complete
MNKWNSLETPPEDDREVLIYVRNLKTPHWSRYIVGSHIDNKWYLRGGMEAWQEPVRWLDIPIEEELKTSEEWGNMFERFTIIKPDGWDRKNFEFSWFKELITERQYVSRLTQSITSYNNF